MLVVCSDIHVLWGPLMSAEATRMQDLASEFSKNFPGVIPPDHHSGRGRTPLALTPSPASGRARGASAPGVGTQTLVPLNFSAVVAPVQRVSCNPPESESRALQTPVPHLDGSPRAPGLRNFEPDRLADLITVLFAHHLTTFPASMSRLTYKTANNK